MITILLNVMLTYEKGHSIDILDRNLLSLLQIFRFIKEKR